MLLKSLVIAVTALAITAGAASARPMHHRHGWGMHHRGHPMMVRHWGHRGGMHHGGMHHGGSHHGGHHHH